MAERTADSDGIRTTELAEALGERYLAYALSTIVSRSLPDVRDGLKPVHRRLLYAMRQLKLDPNQGFKKCARVVGDVIGRYHPHGDQAVYDAMVRLAQDFAVRFPLVEGQGNFGNVDGDNAAAMRYTEARLTEVAQALMEGLDDDAADFRETYDGTDSEPVVMPARFPNLLANGSSGIAVGMATNIPPHNVEELCDALLLMLRKQEPTLEELVAAVPGPDFPTGGVLVEGRDSILEAYRTGRGGFRLRARWGREDLRHGLFQIVVTEIPYQVQKAKLVERIAELMQARKLPLLADVRDESTEDVRLVLEPKSRTVDPAMLMEQLFRATDLEVRFGLNMNVLDEGTTPKVMSLAQVLRAFLDHRHDVLVRRANHRLGRIAHRLEVLDGYLVAFLNLDEVIRIIREEDEAKPALIAAFRLTDLQAESILNMRLRSLRKLEEMEIRTEHDKLSAEQAELRDLLGDEARRWKAIADEVRDIRKRFGKKTALGRRRTDFGEAPADVEVPLEAMIEREDITVVVSQKGWVRTVKGHIDKPAELRFKEGDSLRLALHAATTDKLLVMATSGRFYTLGCERLPGGRGHGEPLRLQIDMPKEDDIADIRIFRRDGEMLVAASDGRGFRVADKDCLAQTRGGKQVLTPGKGAQALLARRIPEGADTVACIGTNRRLAVFDLEEVPSMNRGRGVILQRFHGGKLSDVKVFPAAEGLTWATGQGTRRESDLTAWRSKRGGNGKLPPHGFPRSNLFSE